MYYFICSDGTVSLSELEEFLFPDEPDSDGKIIPNESGIVIDLTRKALIAHLSSIAATGSDEAILEQFSAL